MKNKKKDHRKYHRGRRKKKGGIVSALLLMAAAAVFCVSAYQLYHIFSGYHKGRAEYDKVKTVAVKGEEKEEGFRVNFDKLQKLNEDTVGWIRFFPEPSQINYPLVQGRDNDTYLHRTFSDNENTVGAIFVNIYNHPDFDDKNTIIYGHRMNDNSMFHDLEKYGDKAFWEANPYFYIYTPDGREITYHIYSAGQVKDTSDTYLTDFPTKESFLGFLEHTRKAGVYETGVGLSADSEIVTLSTCTKASDENRFVVRGVKEKERIID